MMETILYYVHYAVLLIFGVVLSVGFSGIAVTKANVARLALLAALCGLLQITVFGLLGESAVWQWYPIITHLPIVLALRFWFGRHIANAVTATASAYLCCPSLSSNALRIIYLSRSLTCLRGAI